MTTPNPNSDQGELFPTSDVDPVVHQDPNTTNSDVARTIANTLSSQHGLVHSDDEVVRQGRIAEGRSGGDLRKEQTGFQNPYHEEDVVLPTGTEPQIGDTRMPGSSMINRRSAAPYTKEHSIRQAHSALELASTRYAEHRKEIERQTLKVPTVLGDQLVFSNPFFRALSLETVEADPDWVADNTPEDYQHADPDFISESLRTPYNNASRYSIGGVVFNRGEFWATTRNPKKLTDSLARKISMGQNIKDLDISERKAAVHHDLLEAIDKKISTMGKMIGRLRGEARTLDSVGRYINMPAFEGSGYAKVSPEEMAPIVQAALKIFKNMLEVTGARYRWADAEYDGAVKSMVERLFTGKPESKLEYWNKLLLVGTGYNRNKFMMMGRKQRELIEHKQSLETGSE